MYLVTLHKIASSRSKGGGGSGTVFSSLTAPFPPPVGVPVPSPEQGYRRRNIIGVVANGAGVRPD